MTSVPVLTLRTHDPEDTRALAAAAASLLRAGDVISLTGELGAGKTCFVQGLARELGVTRRVTSPTFNLVRIYDEVDPTLVHCDVYRLDRIGDVFDLGEDILGPDVLTCVEWGDAVAQILPDDWLEVALEFPTDPVDPAPSKRSGIDDAGSDVSVLSTPRGIDDAGGDGGAPSTPRGKGDRGDEVGAPSTPHDVVEADVEAERVLLVRPHGRWAGRIDELCSAWTRWLGPERQPC